MLCLSGHDPCGGAGIHADIEAISAQRLHALSVITALTVQDTHNVRRVSTIAPEMLGEQIALLVADCDIRAIKIGLLGDAAQVPVIVDAIRVLGVPVVLDPVLRAGGGSDLAGPALQAAVVEQLLPVVTLVTPNAAEARRLAPQAGTLADCASFLLTRGCKHVLITGGDEQDAEVINTWYRPEAGAHRFTWPRLPETFHGAGCTLASAIAARLGAGESMASAIEQGQHWTQQALARALAVGQGRRIPFRR